MGGVQATLALDGSARTPLQGAVAFFSNIFGKLFFAVAPFLYDFLSSADPTFSGRRSPFFRLLATNRLADQISPPFTTIGVNIVPKRKFEIHLAER